MLLQMLSELDASLSSPVVRELERACYDNAFVQAYRYLCRENGSTSLSSSVSMDQKRAVLVLRYLARLK